MLKTCSSLDGIPQTSVEYLEAKVERSARRGSLLLWKVLYLGAFCGSLYGGAEYKFDDKVSECSYGNNWGVSPRDYGSDVFYCYTTLEIDTADNTEGEAVVAPLPAVVVSTDPYTWFEYATSMDCFDLIEA